MVRRYIDILSMIINFPLLHVYISHTYLMYNYVPGNLQILYIIPVHLDLIATISNIVYDFYLFYLNSFLLILYRTIS